MPVPHVDLELLARACSDGDLSAFEPSRELGWTLDETRRRALLHALANTNHHRWYSYGESIFTLAQALGLVTEAATNESGIAITEQVRSLGLGKEIAIAYRTDRAIHFGVRYASNTPMTPGHLWPELKPWYKVLERNRRQLEAWSENVADLVEIPRAARRAAEPASDVDLLSSIVADPHDDGLRLVYADMLVARGDAQGELIQLCERRRAARDSSLDEPIKALERAFGERIAGEVAQLATDYTLSRGFVSHIEMAAPTFAKHGSRLLGRHPIDRLDLKPVNDQALSRLARAEAVRGLRGLYVSQIIGRTRPMRFDDLCACPFFDKLETLDIWTWVTAGEPEASFARLRAPRLVALHLYEVDAAPRVLAGLSRNGGIRLRRLEVNLRGGERWPAVFGSHVFGELSSLELDVRADAAVLQGARLPALVDLRAPDLPLGLALPRLLRLGLDDSQLDAAGFERLLVASPQLRALRIWRAPNLDVDRAIEVALALPDGHALASLQLPTKQADPERVAQIESRFGRSFYDFSA